VKTVKVAARLTQEPEHEMATFLTPKREVTNETIRADTGIVSGTPVAGIEIFTGPLKNNAGGTVMFTVVPASTLTLVAPVETEMVLLQRLVILNCASAPEAQVPANTATTNSSAANFSITASKPVDFHRLQSRKRYLFLRHSM
jgi:hypothetical protein